MEMIKCKNCGSKFSRSDNLRRHEKSCVVQNERETLLETSVINNNDAKSNDDSPILVNRINNDGISVVKKDDSKWSNLIDSIINKDPDSGSSIIQPLKSNPMNHVVEKMTRDSDGKEPVAEILSDQKIAKKRNITHPGSENESSEDGSIVDHPVKKQKLDKTDADSLIRSENLKPFPIDELNAMSSGSKNIDTGKVQLDASDKKEEDHESDVDEIGDNTTTKDEQENQSHIQEDENDGYEVASDYDLNDNEDDVFEKGEGEGANGDESDNNDNESISKEELKDRLYRSGNNMKVFELNLDADEGLTNIDILKYIDVLKVPKFRGVFMRDELPEQVHTVECGIVNLSTHEHLGTHWVCYAKIHTNRIYFDSFGRKTPLEIQKYLKTAKEYRNNIPVIKRNTDVVQRPKEKICGHLCLFVLTSLMREHLSFQQVIDELNYGYSHYYW